MLGPDKSLRALAKEQDSVPAPRAAAPCFGGARGVASYACCAAYDARCARGAACYARGAAYDARRAATAAGACRARKPAGRRRRNRAPVPGPSLFVFLVEFWSNLPNYQKLLLS